MDADATSDIASIMRRMKQIHMSSGIKGGIGAGDMTVPSPGLVGALAPTATPLFSPVLNNDDCVSFDIMWFGKGAAGVDCHVSDPVSVPQLGLELQLIRNDVGQMAVLVTGQDVLRSTRVPLQFTVSGLRKPDATTHEVGHLNFRATTGSPSGMERLSHRSLLSLLRHFDSRIQLLLKHRRLNFCSMPTSD